MGKDLAETAADMTTGELLGNVIVGLVSKGEVIASDLGKLGDRLKGVPKAASWKKISDYLRQNNVDVSAWNKGSFDSAEDSIARHFEKHGKEVGAVDVEQYMRKAEAFADNLKGAKKYPVPGAVDGVTRYVKNGKYIDMTIDNEIISYGKR